MNGDSKSANDKVYAIIPAAGQGSRMGDAKGNKQFLELCGIPIIARTLRAFEKFGNIDGIVVVTSPLEKLRLLQICEQYNITKLIGIADGGKTRQDSVRSALDFLDSYLDTLIAGENSRILKENCHVLIHDGARPFVSDDIIEHSIEGVKRYHACGVGVKVKDTIKRVGPDGRIICTPPREELWAIQTPQAFDFLLIERLHRRACSENLNFTDDTAIAEYFKVDVHMVNGEYRNIKITTPEDLLYGEVLLSNNGEVLMSKIGEDI